MYKIHEYDFLMRYRERHIKGPSDDAKKREYSQIHRFSTFHSFPIIIIMIIISSINRHRILTSVAYASIINDRESSEKISPFENK